MNNKQQQAKVCKDWLKSGAITKTALRRFGIAISTLNSWIKRYNTEGEQGVSDKSIGPKILANTKVTKRN